MTMTKITRVEFLKRLVVDSKWHITKAWVPPHPTRSPNRTVHKHRATQVEMKTQEGTTSHLDMRAGDTYHADESGALEVHTVAKYVDRPTELLVLRYEPGHV